MGVKDLWQLLGPIGRRISIETLEGKILAIDMSIWLTQFIKAMRDDDGNMIKNAHLLGTLRRILKLMYHKIKPIFIFDGATPELKLRTIKLRRKILEKNEESRRSTIHKLLLAQIKAQLRSSLQNEATKQADKNLESNVLSTFNLPQKKVSPVEEESTQQDSKQEEPSQQTDSLIYTQPSSSINLLIEDENDVEWESGPIPNKPQRKKLLADESSEGEPSSESEGDEDDPRYSIPEDYEDLNVDVLASLPHHIRKRIIEEARRKERMKSRANYLPVASNGNLYSQTQLANFLNTSKLNKKFKQAQDKIIGAEDGIRIASEGNKKYTYISKFSLPQTSSLSLGSKSKPISTLLPGQISSSRLLPNAFQMASQNKTTIKEENEDEFQWLNEVDEEVQEQIQKDDSDIEWEPPSCESEGEEPKDQNDDDYYFTERDWSEKQVDNPISNLDEEEDNYFDDYYGEYQSSSTKKKKLIKGKQTPTVSSSNETKPNDNYHPLPTTSSSSTQPIPEFSKPLDWAALIAEDSLARSQSDNIPGFYSNLHADSEDEDSILKSKVKPQVIDLIEDSNPKRVRFEDNIAQVETKENIDDDFDDVEWEEGPSEIQPPTILLPDLTFKKVPSLLDFANVDPSPAVSAITQSPSEITTPKEDITGFINSLQDDFLMQEAFKEKQDAYSSFDMFSEHSKTTEDQDQKTIEEAIATASSMTDWAGRVVKRVLSDHLKKSNPSINDNNNNSQSNPPPIMKQEPKSATKGSTSTERPIHMKSIQQINDEDTFHQPWSDRIPDLQSDSKYRFTSVPQPEDSKDSIFTDENTNEDIEQLRKQYQNTSRDTERITEDMKEDVLKLIRVFDLPYIIAPFEAEAQCAVLEGMGLVDGVITEDSDVFLFGAKHVYKNIFNDSKFVEVYMMNDVEKELGLTREDLISFAYFLGSDYTEGVNGIGIVNAMEILQAFPMKDRDGGPLHGLERFKQWLLGFDPLQELLKDIREYQNSKSHKQHQDKNEESLLNNANNIELADKEEDRIKEEEEKLIQFDKKHKHGKMKWTLPEIFPDNRVVKAYLQPPANRERLEFEWPLPMRNHIRDFCRLNLGWTDAQMDLQIDPVLSKWANKGQMQTRIDSHFILNYQDDTRFAKIASKRLRSAIGQIIGSNESHLFQKEQQTKSKKPRKSTKQTSVVLGNNSDDNLNDNLILTEETLLPSESIASLVEKQTNRNKSRGRKTKTT